jgi:ankyrin repeat protein
MFNFLFDGRIGDILAPVVPTNQLFLAIQHNKNDQIVGLLQSTGYDARQLHNGEYSAIHVACRYNNRYALDLLLSKGTFDCIN